MKHSICKCTLLLTAVIIFQYFLINIFIRQPYPKRSPERLDYTENLIYRQLIQGKKSNEIDWSSLDGTLTHIGNEYDCSDFKLVNLIRILYDYPDSIPQPIYDRIRKILLDFRFWWDDKGGNSMCYWSENHQILFASAEHLIGAFFRNEYFTKASMSGSDLSERALSRINTWLELKWKYGFTEYYSNVYYIETIAALVNIIDYSPDTLTRIKTKIVLDLLLYDLAQQSFKGNFVSTSSRAYEGNRKFSDMGGMDKYFLGKKDTLSCRGMLIGLMTSKQYDLPKVIFSIANDTSTCVIRQSNGIDLCDISEKGFSGQNEQQLMMQWGMEAFVNPEVVQNTIKAMRSKHMFRNTFLNGMKWLDFPLIRNTGLLKNIVIGLNPFLFGTALQKGDTYIFRTQDYSIYTSQSYHPGEAADQQHIFGFNMPGGISVFHSHPALSPEIKRTSPNYWVGYGRLPHSVQEKNVNLSIYRIPEKRMFLETEILDYTYLFYPEEKFDTTLVSDNIFFARSGNSYCAVIATNGFSGHDKNQLIQKGNVIGWISEMGNKSNDGKFENFIQRISQNSYKLENECLIYKTNGVLYKLDYKGKFEIDGKSVCTEYNGYDSPYMQTTREELTRTIKCGSDSLVLNFYEGIRDYSH